MLSFVPAVNPRKPGSYEAQQVQVVGEVVAGTNSPASLVGQWLRGRVKSFAAQNGWGFLTCSHFSEDVFVSYRLAPNLREVNVQKDMTVEFLLQESATKPGTYEASGVRLAAGVAAPLAADMAMWQGAMANRFMQPMHMMQPMRQMNNMHMAGGMMPRHQGGCMAQMTMPMGGGAQSAAAFVGGFSVQGMVKSFNVEKGWGFLVSNQFQDDVFVSYKLAPGLRNVAESGTTLEGMSVSFVVEHSKSGRGGFEAHSVQLHVPMDMSQQMASRSPMAPRAPMAPSPRVASMDSMGGGCGGYGPAGCGGCARGGCYGAGKGAAAGNVGPYAKPCAQADPRLIAVIGKTVTGTIKSFCAEKGWGFVNADGFLDDLFFGLKTNPHLREVDGSCLARGAACQFKVQASQKNPGACEAVEVGLYGG